MQAASNQSDMSDGPEPVSVSGAAGATGVLEVNKGRSLSGGKPGEGGRPRSPGICMDWGFHEVKGFTGE